MLLTDYFKSQRDLTWDFAKQCGVNHGVIRMPETPDFDICDFSHWKSVHKRFLDFGITPVIIEPMPNALHDHIKAGDEKRDECIEKVITMLSFFLVLTKNLMDLIINHRFLIRLLQQLQCLPLTLFRMIMNGYAHLAKTTP